MVIIAVIEKNRCNFDRMEEFALPLLYKNHNEETRKRLKKEIDDYIWSEISPHIKFIELDEMDDFITSVCSNLISNFPDKNPDQFFYHTEGSYSFPKKYIEFIYCQPTFTYTDGEVDNMNNIGCLLSLKHNVVENTCVVFANRYDLSANNFVVLDSISKEDLIRIIRRRFFFTAILVTPDNQLIKYYYQNPTYLITQIFGVTQNDNIERLSFCHLKYNFLCYFQHNKSLEINPIATRINGSYRLYGNVLFLHEMEENVYANLSVHEMKRINVLSYGRLYDRNLKAEEIHTIPKIEVNEEGEQTETKTTPYWSRYIVIDHRMNQWQKTKDKCINCLGKMTKPLVCSKCYRARYCSPKCEKEFASYHSDECLKN